MSEGPSPHPAGGLVFASVPVQPSEDGSEPPAAVAPVSTKLSALEEALSVVATPARSTRYGEGPLFTFWGMYRTLCPVSGANRFPLGNALAVADLTCLGFRV